MGAGEYVCGLEPATHAMAPHAELQSQGLPNYLNPGEKVDFELFFSILADFNIN